MSLNDFSDAQLKNELARREEIRKQQLREERKNRAEYISEHIDWLLTFMSEHSRTSCSDKNPCNEHRGCVRCNLIDAKRCGYWPEDIELVISVRELPSLD